MKKVSLLLVLVFATITISAQESGFSTKEGRKATFARNGFWDNWFIGLGAGANFVLGDDNGDADFLNRLTVAPTIQVGKWYNPYIGGRLKFQGGSLHNFQNNATDMIHNKYFAVEADVMWDVTNYLGRYNEKRVYSLIPYIGIGGGIGWDYKLDDKTHPGGKQRNFTINGGIINKFRFSERVALDIDLSAMLLKESFNHGGSNSYDGLVAASASLVFKVGSKTDFSEALLMDQPLLDDLNRQINQLRQENDRLRNQPAKEVIKEVVKDCPKCPEATKGSFVSNVVFFRLGSANIDKNQEVSIFNTAKYLKDNPSAKVKVVGYADRKTGTPSINEKLSEKRAKNVANELIKKYNIDSNRVTVEWKGDKEQPYAENAWNRVAIFIAQ
ncbi:OmpA family protein [Prevotella sp. 10(H)]|uniref:OmpA family protein n=1 Tax=Prevotella sp. 10(H) TaxID=1158294 RepID=UPI0004A7561A|nr:OmpA family protein [Prevotella sp. 10(H)]